jgi:hypothetical protein
MARHVILALLFSAYATSMVGAQGAGGPAELSREEKRYAERLILQSDLCGGGKCSEQAIDSLAQIIRARRMVRGELMSDVTLSQLKQSCDEHENDVQGMLQCLTLRQKVSFEDGMRLAGYTRAGITSEGYTQLRIGMEMREVEYILGDYGEELSYASSGGYSASTYQWTAGRRIIIVSFADYKVSGRSQSGLYRD